MKKILSLSIVLIMLFSVVLGVNGISAEAATVNDDLNYVDLNNWQEEPFVSGNGVWDVQDGGRTVKQTENGNPTFFTSPDTEVLNEVIKGTISVNTTGDDDMIGFVLGFQDPISSGSGIDVEYDSDFIVFDWKQGFQENKTTHSAFTSNEGAIDGFSLIHIDGYLDDTE